MQKFEFIQLCDSDGGLDIMWEALESYEKKNKVCNIFVYLCWHHPVSFLVKGTKCILQRFYTTLLSGLILNFFSEIRLFWVFLYFNISQSCAIWSNLELEDKLIRNRHQQKINPETKFSKKCNAAIQCSSSVMKVSSVFRFGNLNLVWPYCESVFNTGE